jgi:hypothetical protein
LYSWLARERIAKGAHCADDERQGVPIGLYGVAPVGDLAVGNLVTVTPPPLLASLLAERGYLPLRVPLIKRILALPAPSTNSKARKRRSRSIRRRLRAMRTRRAGWSFSTA